MTDPFTHSCTQIPLPPTTANPPSEYESLLAEGRVWNGRIILGIHACWMFGASFISFAALLPVFLKELGASNTLIGLLPGLMTLCMFAPQVLTAQFTAPLAIKKKLLTVIHYPGCIALFVMALLAQKWGASRPDALIAVTLAAMCIHALGLSFAMPMWTNLIAKLLPAASLGRQFGKIFAMGGLAGIAGAVTSRWLLRTYEFPNGFAIGFFITSGLLSSACTFFLFLREPVHPEPHPRRKLGQYLEDLRRDLRGNRNYQYYLLVLVASSFGKMALPFYAVAARERFHLPTESAAEMTVLLMLAGVIASPIAGRIGDRFGFRLLALFSPGLAILAALLALVVNHPAAFYAIFVLGGFARSADSLASINLPIQFSPHADKTTFLAVRGTLISPVMAAAPIVGGLLADNFRAGFNLPFGGAILFEGLGLLILATLVRDPRRGRD